MARRRRQPDDVLEVAGYPEADQRRVRVLRDGRLVAVASYERRWGRWLCQQVGSCWEYENGRSR